MIWELKLSLFAEGHVKNLEASGTANWCVCV